MYDIIGTYRGQSEVVDTAETRKEAEYLRGEYQVAYGAGWGVTIRRSREPREISHPYGNPRRARTRSGRIRELIHEGIPDGHGQAGAIAYRETRAGKLRANPRRRLPSASDVDVYVWAERDRQHVEARDRRTDQTIAEWWDEAVSEMIEDGFFYAPHAIVGLRMPREKQRFEESVIAYLRDQGLVA